ncbi:MAG: acyltransferase family protein [Bacteroidales bacterium]
MYKMNQNTSAGPKPHYPILDGLRGVAAIVVVWYHVFEGYATSRLDQIINHGYLAVDFFFILSGFVIAYAYDDRWGKMTTSTFLKRRIIRLHPMVVIGSFIGCLLFYTQGCDWWDVSVVAFSSLIMGTLMNLFLIPATPGIEIRGIGEMFPLNGPSWSLFFEYIGNVLYGLFIHRFSNKALAFLVILVGIILSSWVILGPQGDVGYGWQLTLEHGTAGFIRMLFSFSLGLLMFRLVKPGKIKGAFGMATILLVAFLVMPRIGNENTLWMNGIYDMACIIFLFPLLVYFGISGELKNKFAIRTCNFLGEISYPLYIIHYPFIYLYIAWVKNENLPFSQSWYGAVGVLAISMLLAYLSLKHYDEPLRKWITGKLGKTKRQTVLVTERENA